jgi:uncharacterized protein (TIGR03435 family)
MKMKRYTPRLQEFVDQASRRVRNLPEEQVELAGKRVLEQLRREPEWESDSVHADSRGGAGVVHVSKFAIIAVAAAIVFVVFIPRMIPRNVVTDRAGARAESVEQSKFHTSGDILMRQDAGRLSEFEVVSIRPEALPSGRGRGAGPASALVRCARPYLRVQITPDRFVTSASVYDLIALAYGKDCLSLAGGPDWASSDVFAIQAIIPVGTPAYTATQLRDGDAPELQSMIQTLLRQRFHLALSREAREMDVYNLVVVKADKLKVANPNAPPRSGPRIPTMGSLETNMRRFADNLAGQLDRPVIDKTGLRNSYRMVLEFPELADPPIGANGAPLRMRDLIPEKLEDQLGLRLQPARASLEMLVIDRVDKPSEN